MKQTEARERARTSEKERELLRKKWLAIENFERDFFLLFFPTRVCRFDDPAFASFHDECAWTSTSISVRLLS